MPHDVCICYSVDWKETGENKRSVWKLKSGEKHLKVKSYKSVRVKQSVWKLFLIVGNEWMEQNGIGK